MKTMKSHRLFLVATLVCVLLGMLALVGCTKDDKEAPSISVTENDVTSIANFKENLSVPATTKTISLLPNSIVEMDANNTVSVRTKTDRPHPLATLGVANLSSGSYHQLMTKAVSHDEGYDITDARITSDAAVWVETKSATGDWKIYRAPLIRNSSLGDPVLVAEGDDTRQFPSIAAVGTTAIWIDGLVRDLREGGETSYVYASDGGADDKRVIFETTNPIICPLTRSEGTLTVVDWAPKGGSRRSEAHAITIANGEEVAILRIPSPIQISEAIWFGNNEWSFSVPALYSNSGALGQVGTYVQTGETTFTRFPKAPLDTPAKVNGRYIVKNGKSIIDYDPEAKKYSVIDAPDDAPDYGEYVASHGVATRAVLFTQKSPENSPSTATIVREIKP